MDRTAINEQEIAAMAKAARLDLPTDRLTMVTETMVGIFQMLDSLDGTELGETPPAMGFRAKWECR